MPVANRNRFMKRICKDLSLWVSDGHEIDVYNPLAFAIDGNDLLPSKPVGDVLVTNFKVRCEQLTRGENTTNLYLTWAVMRKELQTSKLQPLLIFEINQKTTMVLVTPAGLDIIAAVNNPILTKPMGMALYKQYTRAASLKHCALLIDFKDLFSVKSNDTKAICSTEMLKTKDRQLPIKKTTKGGL